MKFVSVSESALDSISRMAQDNVERIKTLEAALRIYQHAFESGCVDSDLLAAYEAADYVLAGHRVNDMLVNTNGAPEPIRGN